MITWDNSLVTVGVPLLFWFGGFACGVLFLASAEKERPKRPKRRNRNGRK